ncbi:MAG: aldehyde ferredoxin oxidoreductase N-terminal domain-containing protein [Actinomycetota bacterium]
MYGGWTGRLLEVDLDGPADSVVEYPRESAERFLGGFGANNSLFDRFYDSGTEPLSPGNPILLGAGPFVGTKVPGSSRIMANSRLPLTGAIASASGGMGAGVMMKRAGYDHIAITGRAASPSVLVVDGEAVELVPAGGLWGAGTLEATERLHDTYPGSSVIAIGPAGENLVHLAIAMIDCCATLGRGGLGAVMGSKNLKAVVLRGEGRVSVAQPARLKELVGGLHLRCRSWSNRPTALELGMVAAWPLYAPQFAPPGATPDDVSALGERFGPAGYLQLKSKRISCPSCFLPDKDRLVLQGGRRVDSTSFLNAAILGGAFLMESAGEAASTLAELDDLGLDMFTLSNQANCLLDLAAEEVIGPSDVGGLPLERSGALIRGLASLVAGRVGPAGEALAEGWTGALEHFGEETARFTVLVRNQDCIYDPRVSGLGTMEFEQVVSPRGPTSASGGSATYLPGQTAENLVRLTERMGACPAAIGRIFDGGGMNVGRLTRYSEDWFSLFSSLGICNRHQINRFYNPPLIRDLLAAVTGLELEVGEIMGRAAAGWEIYRELNEREGLGRDADVFPRAWLDERPVWGRGGKLHDYFGRELDGAKLESLLGDYCDERSREPG